MRHVVVIVTARPSYSRIKTALVALRTHANVKLTVIAAASTLVTRYGRVVDLIRADGFAPIEIPSVIDGDGTRETALSTGVLLTQLPGILAALKPDVVVTIADRHETLATAIAASYQHIPLCHIQGGEVSGSIDDKVRNAVTQLADLHLVATNRAARNVECMAGGGADIRVTGCPSIDLAAEAKRLGPLPSRKVIVLQHPVSSEAEDSKWQMETTVEALRGMDVTWFWPGEDAGSEAMSKVLRLAGINPIRNLAPLMFLRTLLGARVLVGNSSVGIRECSFLGVPVVNIGTRQQGRERAGNVVDVDHDAEAIRKAVLCEPMFPRVQSMLYGDGHAGERIAAILAKESVEAVA